MRSLSQEGGVLSYIQQGWQGSELESLQEGKISLCRDFALIAFLPAWGCAFSFLCFCIHSTKCLGSLALGSCVSINSISNNKKALFSFLLLYAAFQQQQQSSSQSCLHRKTNELHEI